MQTFRLTFLLLAVMMTASCKRSENTTQITGELMQWHKVTFTVDGPEAHEADSSLKTILTARTGEAGIRAGTIAGLHLIFSGKIKSHSGK